MPVIIIVFIININNNNNNNNASASRGISSQPKDMEGVSPKTLNTGYIGQVRKSSTQLKFHCLPNN